MSEEQAPNDIKAVSLFDDVEFIKREWEGRQTDWLVQWFAGFVNRTSLEIGVTISVGGAQLSGALVSHSTYFSRLAEGFSSAFTKFEGVDIDQLREMILGFDQTPEVAEGGNLPAPQYLHLSDVKIISGGGTINIEGGLWRGKIASIDGFILGR